MSSFKRRMKRAVDLGRSAPPPRRAYGYEIVYTPMHSGWEATVPETVRRALPRLHQTLNSDPAAAIPELERLVEQYPHAPPFYNFLHNAYILVGRKARADAVLDRCRAVLPDYLFGKLAHGGRLLSEERYGEFLELWGGVLDLRRLYPGRTRFHASEFAGFYSLAGVYHLETGNAREAARLLDMLMDAAPNEGGTQQLRERMEAHLLGRLVRALEKDGGTLGS